jgi:hypothetical protein
MNNTIINFIKEQIESENIPPQYFVPEYMELLCNSFALDNEYKENKLTLANLPDYIDKSNIDDIKFIQNFFGSDNFNADLISLDFLAEVLKNPKLRNIIANEKAKRNIFDLFAKVLKTLKDIEADEVVLNSDAILILIKQISNPDHKKYFSAIFNNKVKEVKDFAENIHSLEDLDNIPEPQNMNDIYNALISIYGEDNGKVLQMGFQGLVAQYKDKAEKQMAEIGIITTFSNKVMALRKAYLIGGGTNAN